MKTRTRVWLERLALAGLLTALGEASSTAATLCVNPGGTGGCSSTIQGAVTAAAPGDTVKVNAGVYYENVLVPVGKNGLQIVGASKTTTILDADNYAPLGITTHTGAGITSLSQFVVVKNLMIRNGQDWGIVAVGRGSVFQGLNITGPDGGGILILDWNAQVIQSEIHDVPVGIEDVGGFGSIIKNTTVTNAQGIGALVVSDSAQVTGSHFVNTGVGLEVVGDGALVKGNDIRHQANLGILVAGNSPTVQTNKVFGVGPAFGILAQCTPSCFGGTIAGNAVTDVIGAGIVAQSDSTGLAVQKNTVVRAGTGITLITIAALPGGISAISNKVTDAGIANTGNCFEAGGFRATLSLNTATNCAKDGFYISGDEAILSGNSATSAFENGFTVDGNAGANSNSILTKNKTTLAGGQGFAIIGGAVATTLTSNTGSKSRVDYCDAGAGTILTGTTNSFGSIGTCDITHP